LPWLDLKQQAAGALGPAVHKAITKQFGQLGIVCTQKLADGFVDYIAI
jgi:hypothetical protein